MFPPLFTWGHTMVEGMKIKATSSKRPHARTAALSAPNPAAPPPTPASARDSWTLTGKSGPVSCEVTAPFFWVLVHKVLFVPSKSLSPVLCKFWWLYGGVNGDLLQVGFCHTQVCGTQSPRPCGSPLLTRTSTGDAQTQFCLSLCGVSGPSHVH